MGTLGYDVASGFVYEGPEEPCFPIWPTPVVSYATLLSSPLDEQNIPYGGAILQSTWLFREDSYDPVGRIRRGRLFEPRSGLDPRPIRVEPHPASHGDLKHVHHQHGRLQRTLNVYLDCFSFYDIQKKGVGLRLALGVKPIYTIWKIVQTELTIQEDVLVTLRAESTFGILPEIRKDVVPPSMWPRIDAALNRVADSAHKELPTSVVDQCRQAAAEIIGS